MNRKQLLFVLINLILVGVVIVIVLSLTHSKAVDKSHDDLKNELSFYATKAREYYWRPATFGGGNRSFSGLTISKLSMAASNSIGRFFIVGSPTKDEVVICGIGTITVGKDSTRVQIIVNEHNSTFQIIH